jgi:hypothetical protein
MGRGSVESWQQGSKSNSVKKGWLSLVKTQITTCSRLSSKRLSRTSSTPHDKVGKGFFHLSSLSAQLDDWLSVTKRIFDLVKGFFAGAKSADDLRDIWAGTDRYVLTDLHWERPLTNSPALFVSLKGCQRGLPMTAAGLRSLFRYHRLLTQLPQANPHRFRHTFGTDMVRAGISLPALMHLMGHAHIHTTMLYVELAPKDVWREYGDYAAFGMIATPTPQRWFVSVLACLPSCEFSGTRTST